MQNSLNLESLVLPYTRIVGQEDLKLAIELTYINPQIGGVLIFGERGTAKSTIVRSFSYMMNKLLPITLPINATEDRVIGGWQLDQLLQGNKVWQDGLIKQANNGYLYIDEVNLLDDHIVNLLLDAASTGLLTIQREGEDQTTHVSFGLIGTMNPEEGDLRPQLLDRFGLSVHTTAESAVDTRIKILKNILEFDSLGKELHENDSELLDKTAESLIQARERIKTDKIGITVEIYTLCDKVAQDLGAEGHRGSRVLVHASKALASREKAHVVKPEHVRRVALMSLQHRLVDYKAHERLSISQEQVDQVFDQGK